MIETTKLAEHTRFVRWFFEKVMPSYGYALREMQIELAEEAFVSMNNGSIMLAEAAVGAGKTMAYLLPAVLIRRNRLNESMLGARLPDGHPMPVLIATSSIALQTALITDYIPALSKILIERGLIKKPLTTAIRKGKSHYLCEHRLAEFSKTANDQALSVIAPLRNRDIVDLSALKGITPSLKRSVCVGEQCGSNCPLHENCRYTRFIRNANKGGFDFQVVNHNLFMADLSLRAQKKKPLIPDYQMVILDEAHKFFDAARDMYGTELTLSELHRVVQDVKCFTLAPKQRTQEMIRWADKIHSKSRLLFQFPN